MAGAIETASELAGLGGRPITEVAREILQRAGW